ncbi:hypothetical protein SAMN05216223_102442 [Actinacidiphila yanglinensis]|uniref:Uncharacterized protein n=1 Tax=Actinacidiphila yanglinensis TaxID=310779 RepID=A0A1H5VUQ2_9ACTN|nr:hypothetical protein SAMN05216223_102442 [Actinacidiphila yanglinensis]
MGRHVGVGIGVTTSSERRAQIAWVGAAVFGAAVEHTTWNLSVRPRKYCDAGFDSGGGFERMFYLPLIAGAGVVLGVATCAATQYFTRSAPAPVRVCAVTLLVVLTTLLLGWSFFPLLGTLNGCRGDSGLCPASNIPPWWPTWIPA